jgi:hypothetical protein
MGTVLPWCVAVGTALAGGPPRRSQRARLTHWAPALGHNVKARSHLRVRSRCFTHAIERTWRALPGSASGARFARRVPLGRSPSLHHLRPRHRGFVRQLRRYYGTVRLPTLVHRGLTASAFPPRPAPPSSAGERGISRFSRMKVPYVPGFLDRAGPTGDSRHNATGGIAFRPIRRRRHPEQVSFRGSIAQPARTPVNASPAPSRTPTHDSGPSWLARPCDVGLSHPLLHAGLSRRSAERHQGRTAGVEPRKTGPNAHPNACFARRRRRQPALTGGADCRNAQRWLVAAALRDSLHTASNPGHPPPTCPPIAGAPRAPGSPPPHLPQLTFAGATRTPGSPPHPAAVDVRRRNENTRLAGATAAPALSAARPPRPRPG